MKIKSTLVLLIGIISFSCDRSGDLADAYGNFESDEVTISTEVSGRLIKFSVSEGAIVRLGDTVGLIDTIQLHLQKSKLLASINALRTRIVDVDVELSVIHEQISNIRREYDRAQTLLKENAATQQLVDDLKGQLNLANRQLHATKIRLKNSNNAILSEIQPILINIQQVDDQIQRSIIKTPVNGTVLTKYVEETEIVNFGKPLFKVADLTRVYLRAYISEDQLASVKIGGAVKVGIDDGEGMKMYDGEVSWISDVAEFTPKIIQTKSERKNLVYALKVAISNDGTIKLGMPGELHLK